MRCVIFLFDGITALDAVGPYEVLSRIPGARVTFAGLQAGVVRSADGALGLHAGCPLGDVASCDLLLVPGGPGTRALAHDERLLTWVRAVDATTRITASVCTGALILAAAGLLRGRKANTHWAMRDRLAADGAIPVAQRVVRDGKYATAAGVSAGIDLALLLALELSGRRVAEAIQLGIEYDPAPPLHAGDPERAPAALCDAVLARIRAREGDEGR